MPYRLGTGALRGAGLARRGKSEPQRFKKMKELKLKKRSRVTEREREKFNKQPMPTIKDVTGV